MTAILVVDDSLTVRMDLAEALEAAGFEPVPCATLAEARRALATRTVALAILDVRLPDGDGVELLRELRASAQHAALPILMLSSEAEIADRLRGLRTGANDYVGKPYDAALVIARVRELAGSDAAPETPLVLVIDDSTTFRESLAATLFASGYRTITAASGTEGLRHAAAHRPGAVIVDGVMPDMRGDVVIRKLRLDPALRATPCLLLTGSDDAAAEIQALDAGADAFARKESDVDQILARFGAMLRSADGVRAAETATPPAAKRVLLVDASARALQPLADRLQQDGYDVVQSRSGEQALDLLAVQPVDCILLETQVPGLSGIETCRRIKAVPALRTIPLIAMTADETGDAMLEMLAAGADDFVSKSAGHEVVSARVKAQIRRKQLGDEHRHLREQVLRAAHAEELARANAELTAANRELGAANRELEAFSYSVSHDLRAPLRSIRMFSEALEEDAGSRLDGQAKEHLLRIRNATQRMGELIEALLALARISRSELTRSAVDLSAIASALVDELRTREPERRVDATIEPALAASADPRLVRVVLDNLLGNAWKFTAKRERAHIAVGAHREAGERAFFVRDDGAGFDMTRAERLYLPFQRLHGREFPGTGIGLATVHRIIERHHGRIWVKSAVGEGTTVYFTLADRST